MPEKNRTYRARIEGYTSEGLGVARIDGQAVFVHRALRGEDCDVLILKVLKNAAFVNVFSNEISTMDIAVTEGLIVGMGSYHGKKSFDTFTHARSIVKKSTWLDLPMRYHPYSEKKLGIIKRFMK